MTKKKTIAAYMSEIGQRGGSAKTEAKARAAAQNAKKAVEARRLKRAGIKS